MNQTLVRGINVIKRTGWQRRDLDIYEEYGELAELVLKNPPKERSNKQGQEEEEVMVIK